MSATEQTAAPAPTESDKPKRDGTDYVVLEESDESNNGWYVIEHVKGVSSAGAAIQKALDNVPEPETGRFVAVPVRSWKPVKVSVETVSRVKLEEA